MALLPWNVIAAGRLRSDEEERRREESGEGGRTFTRPDWRRNEVEKKASHALEKVAKEHGNDISVSAGKSLCRLQWILLRLHSCVSCNCICDAQGTICVPYYWRSESRTSSR
jgi:hypothetical protein